MCSYTAIYPFLPPVDKVGVSASGSPLPPIGLGGDHDIGCRSSSRCSQGSASGRRCYDSEVPPGVGGAKAPVVAHSLWGCWGCREAAPRSLGLQLMLMGLWICLWGLWPIEEGPPGRIPCTHFFRWEPGLLFILLMFFLLFRLI